MRPQGSSPTGWRADWGYFAQHLNAQEFSAFLPVPSAPAFLADDLPHFGHERARQRFVPLQNVVHVQGEVADGNRTVLHSRGHQGTQAVAAGVILHPARLESGILPIVAKDQQPGPFGVVHHVLGENVHVGHVSGANRPSRLPVPPVDPPSGRPA